MLRPVSRKLAYLLLAGVAVTLAGHAAAQTAAEPAPPAGSQPAQAPPSGGLILPGAVQQAPSSSPAAGTIQQRPQQGPPQQAPAAAPARPQGAAPAAGTGAAQAPRPQQQAPGAQQQARQAGKTGTPSGEWLVEPEVFSDGTFRHCVVQNRFDNNLALGFIQGPQKKVNMIIGVPGGRLPQGATFPTKVRIDSKPAKEIPALVINPEVVGVDIVRDESIVQGVRSGNALHVEVPGDTLSFQLKGTTKALNDLSACVDQAMAGQLQLPPPPPAMPPSLAKLLVDAGLKEARALPVDKMPPQARRGDFEWMLGDKVRGHVRRLPIAIDGADIEKVSADYIEALKPACSGTLTQSMGTPEKVQYTSLRTGNITCEAPDGKVYVSMVFQLLVPPADIAAKAKEQGQDLPALVNIFSHETADTNKAKADEATAGVLRELKKVAALPLPKPGQGQAPQGQAPQAQPPKP